MALDTITILGAGSFGLTLSWLLSEAGKNVCLYTRNQEKIQKIIRYHKIDKPLSVTLKAKSFSITDDPKIALDSAIFILCCPAQAMRDVAKALATQIDNHTQDQKPIILSTVKGLELHSFKRMSQILEEEISMAKIAVLSGPNLAKEILRGLPAAAVIASKDLSIANFVRDMISVPKFRVYSSDDVTGVEFGGAFKNIVAIAAGAADGFNLGTNAKAALLTRGLAEIVRLSVHLGAKPGTLAGLAGMGDVLTSCNSSLSRNYNLGFQMAKGKSLEKIMKETGAVIEGITTTEAVCELSKEMKIDLPIARVVQSFLTGSLTPTQAIAVLMNRPLVSE